MPEASFGAQGIMNDVGMLTSEMVRAARALIRWEQRDLAAASKVSLPTIKRLEAKAGKLGAHEPTIQAIELAFERAGVQFIFENGEGIGVRYR